MDAEKLVTPPADLSFEDTGIAFSYKTDLELYKAFALFSSMNSNLLVKAGTSMVRMALATHMPIKTLIKHSIFAHFCGGESIEECEPVIQRMGQFNLGTILDYSVEGERSAKGFDITEAEIIRTIRRAKGHPYIPFSVFKVTGLAMIEVLEKVQAKEKLTDKEEEAWARAQKRVDNICRAAYESDVRVFIDAEETWMQGTIDFLAETMMAKYNKERPIVYNTYQMYVADKLRQLKADVAKAKEQGYFLGAKLVRGAYMEKERARAKAKGYPDPIQPSKAACDVDFDASLDFCIEHRDMVAICAGTHNEESSLRLASLIDQAGIERNHPHFFFAQLYGMGDHISFNLVNAGYNVAKYVPYGPVASVMPYLFRRADENTSIAGQSSREYLLIKKEVARRKSCK